MSYFEVDGYKVLHKLIKLVLRVFRRSHNRLRLN